MNVLTGSSVEACNIANNHTADFGTQGEESTVSTLTAAGIGYFGTGKTWIWEKDGIRIGFVSFTSTDQAADRLASYNAVRAMKADGVNAVIFTFHGGTEYGRLRSAYQENVARFAVNAGSDLVIMHHPHVLMGIEKLSNRLAFYSLGNFCFGGNRAVKALQTMIVRCTLVFSDDGTYIGEQLALIPANTSGTEDYNNYCPTLVTTAAEAEACFQLVRHDTTTVRVPDYDASLGCVLMDYLPASDDAPLPEDMDAVIAATLRTAE